MPTDRVLKQLDHTVPPGRELGSKYIPKGEPSRDTRQIQSTVHSLTDSNMPSSVCLPKGIHHFLVYGTEIISKHKSGNEEA